MTKDTLLSYSLFKLSFAYIIFKYFYSLKNKINLLVLLVKKL